MKITLELGIMLVVQILTIGIFVGQIKGFKDLFTYRLNELEKKQDKHNNLIQRMTIVEQSTKSAHHRIDEIKKQENEK